MENKKTPCRVYFAHSHSSIGTTDEEMIAQELEARGYQVVNPFLDAEHEEKEYVKRIKRAQLAPWKHSYTREDAERLVAHDLETIDSCDVLLAWLNSAYTQRGTVIEMAYAKMKGKKVIVIAETGFVSPWTVAYADEVYDGVPNWIIEKPMKLGEKEVLDAKSW